MTAPTQLNEQLALIADMHGNAVALDAVLSDISSSGIRDFVCLGDVASMGPHPAEVLRRVRDLRCPVVMGNADAFLLDPTSTSEDELRRRVDEIDAWCAEQLSESDLDFIRTFQATATVELGGGGELLCYHGSPRSFDEIIAPTTPDDELGELLGDRSADVFAGGHTHFQMYRRHLQSIVINPGSAGWAYDRTQPIDEVRMAGWAEYAVVHTGNLSVGFRRVPYDKELVARAIAESGMPHSDWWAEEWRAA
ncbi:MAG: metallophosphatase family protein [Chloroflexota bacterium]|nr:metallophosphatase family protein [Chloroflexota bacterium]